MPGELAPKAEVHHLPADPMVSMIERVVMDPNSDLAKLERMLDMKERLEEREARRAFDRAIADAKAKIGPIVKDGLVDYETRSAGRTTFRHETLAGIAKVVDPVLSEHGLSYRFRSEQADGAVRVTCIVAHRDGHSEETALQGAPDTSGSKNSYQAVGSAATYLQRYTLKLALGLSATNGEDDGKGATPAAPTTITEEQFRELRDLLEKTGTDENKFKMAFGAKTPEAIPLEQFPAKDFERAKAQLLKKLAKLNAEKADG